MRWEVRWSNQKLTSKISVRIAVSPEQSWWTVTSKGPGSDVNSSH